MALNFEAPFAQVQKQKFAEPTTAVGTISGTTPTNTVLLGTLGIDGALMTSLTARPRATVTATALYLFASLDGGTNKFLVKSVLMLAHTVAATTAIPDTDFGFTVEDAKRLGDNSSGNAIELYVGIGVTGNVVFEGNWTDY